MKVPCRALVANFFLDAQHSHTTLTSQPGGGSSHLEQLILGIVWGKA